MLGNIIMSGSGWQQLIPLKLVSLKMGHIDMGLLQLHDRKPQLCL